MNKEKSWSYKEAGVNIDEGNQTVELIKPFVKRTFRPEVLAGLGGFGGLFALDTSKYREPVLVSGTDGVGTKLKIAFQMNKHDTIGIDAVAMCVNDVLVCGAEPLFFLDYLAVGKLEAEQAAEIVKGIAEGCVQSGCALIGGETAEMPGFYPPGEYDVAGFVVGVVEKSKLIDGSTIKEGDSVFALPSSGLHSNGFSLARKVFEEEGTALETFIPELEGKLGDILLTPTVIYHKALQKISNTLPIKGMAHITGGGILENIPRILPEGLTVLIDKKWTIPPIFVEIAKRGNIHPREMLRTFNMGIGMVIIIEAEASEKLKKVCSEMGQELLELGRIVVGKDKVLIKEGLFEDAF